MDDRSEFSDQVDNTIRADERSALHEEMVARLHQKGVMIAGDAPTDDLADLLSAIDQFEAAVEGAGGDLFVDSPTSSQPERPEFVLPRMADDETVSAYTSRVRAAAARLDPMAE